MKRTNRRAVAGKRPRLEPLERRDLLSVSWSNVEVTGGGYISAVHVHPADPEVIWARTDVGGMYRVDEAAGRMTQVMDWIPPEQDDMYGVAGLALHPTDTSVLYAALGKYFWSDESGVFYSEDSGETWQDLGLDLTYDANNGPGRWGTRLAFNPHNPDQLIIGSYGDGAYRHIRSTGNTVRITSIGSDDNDRIQAIVFDPTTPNNVYVAVDGKGVYRSTFGISNSFVLIAGSPTSMNDMELSRDGQHLVVATETGVVRLDNPASSSSWSNLSLPIPGPHYTIDFSPHDDDTLITSRGGYDRLGTIVMSTDAGDSWTALNSTVQQSIQWMPEEFPGSSISDFEWDPVDPNRVHFTDWYSLWETSDITASTVNWSNPNATGHVEVVANALAVPRSTNTEGIQVLTGYADVGGFRHTDTTVNPAFSTLKGGAPSLIDITGIGVSDADPDRQYLVGMDKNSFNRASLEGGFARWDATAGQWALSSGYDPTWGYGRIAVSHTSADRLVVATSHGGVRYSTDGGQTFAAAVGAPSSDQLGLETDFVWNYIYPLTGDGAANDHFYLYSRGDGRLYRSVNGGQTWLVANRDLPLPQGTFDLSSTPGRAGHLWLAIEGAGLLRSTDGGSNWQTMADVQEATMVAVGKAAPGADYEAVYLYGRANGDAGRGVYRSNDEGATWERIGTSESGIANSPQVMTADPDRYGVVYIGTNGRGVARSAPAAAPIAGDYDLDGLVTETDYQTWVTTFGQAVAPGTGADGNGDGVVNAADYSVWRDAYQPAPVTASALATTAPVNTTDAAASAEETAETPVVTSFALAIAADNATSTDEGSRGVERQAARGGGERLRAMRRALLDEALASLDDAATADEATIKEASPYDEASTDQSTSRGEKRRSRFGFSARPDVSPRSGRHTTF
ncbi:MAG: hypothetical protein AAFV43_10280 [Planctomycetota bacterium]